MKLKTLAIVFGVSLFATTAEAYPTAAVFTPTADAKDFAHVGTLVYASSNLSPSVSAGATWLGLNFGLLPKFDYGNSGLKFGGLEVGFDTISPYGVSQVKPVFNAKLGLMTEGKYTPALALGAMSLSPAMPSLSYLYVTATKDLKFGEDDATSFGHFTLGFGGSVGNAGQMAGTFPFNTSDKAAFMLAYESPLLWKRVGFVADHFGGTSELSNTYLGLNLVPLEGAQLTAGAFIASNRSVPAATQDGFFAAVQTNFDVLGLFSSSAPPPAPTPAAAPAPPAPTPPATK